MLCRHCRMAGVGGGSFTQGRIYRGGGGPKGRRSRARAAGPRPPGRGGGVGGGAGGVGPALCYGVGLVWGALCWWGGVSGRWGG